MMTFFFSGDVPTTIEELCALPGVGPKMAHLFVNTTTGVPQGIGVDVHVHRISNRIEWVNNTKSPEHTRKVCTGFDGLISHIPVFYHKLTSHFPTFLGVGKLCTSRELARHQRAARGVWPDSL